MAWWRAGVIGALVVSAACSGAETPSSSDAPSSTGSAVPAVPAAFDFAAPAVGGGTVDVRTYAGETVAVWFWAPY